MSNVIFWGNYYPLDILELVTVFDAISLQSFIPRWQNRKHRQHLIQQRFSSIRIPRIFLRTPTGLGVVRWSALEDEAGSSKLHYYIYYRHNQTLENQTVMANNLGEKPEKCIFFCSCFLHTGLFFKVYQTL